jgi:hypothetical protein
MGLRCTSLIGKDESRANPYARSAEHKCRSNSLTIVDTTCSNNLNRCTSHRASLSLDEIDNSGDENSGRGISSMATTLTTLRTDDVDTEVEALLHVLGVSDHVHVKDAGLVESVNDVLWGDTDGGDEELRAAVDDDVDELVKLALGVVIAACMSLASQPGGRCLVALGLGYILRLSRTSTDLWEQ